MAAGDSTSSRERLDGAAPPWGSYRRGYTSYEMSQYGQTGSGLLGGWSYATSGGYLDVASRARAEAEAWEEYARRRRRPAWASLQGQTVAETSPASARELRSACDHSSPAS